jgi:hypothetical protein
MGEPQPAIKFYEGSSKKVGTLSTATATSYTSTANLTLEEIKRRYKIIKETDLKMFGFNHPARTLKDNTLTNNARLIKKMIDSNPTKKTPIYRRVGLGAGGNTGAEELRDWLDSSGFSISTKRNYMQLAHEMTLYDSLYLPAPLQKNLEIGLTPTLKYQLYWIDKYESQIQEAKGKREVSEKKKEQQVSTSFVYDIIEGLRANNHEAEALIMDILMLYPYRAEVGTLNLQSLESYKKLKKKGGKLGNYLVVGKRKMMVSRSDYKTSDQYGMIENEITDKDLKKKIRDYIEKYEILENQQVFGYTDNQDVSKKLGYLTKKISGISLGPAAIVKVMLSNSPFKDLASAADFLKEMSRIRGTSLSTLQDVYLHSKGLPPSPEQ